MLRKLPSSAINEMIDETFEEASSDKPDNLTGPRCRARFDFEGEGHGDLVFEAGDIIQLLAHCGSDWLKGQLEEKTGIFPASFVEIIEDLPKDMENTAADSRNRETTALFDFEGEHGELSFQAGDKIHVISKVNDQWLYGACSGKEGSFPVSFVDEIPHDLPQYEAAASAADSATNDVASADYKDMTVCVALYDYQSEHEGDLAFKQGDSIEILDSAGTNWLRGRLHGIEGVFPASFVSFQSDPADHMHAVEPGTGLESHSALVLGRALHDFVGETDNELTLQVGDEVILGAMLSEDSEWQWGELNGRHGIFPASFVEML
ncbi:hypothetical protein C0Q70_06326 [Pomacea canaliculata]|uniref:SH3 domain-containing protein n=1 Tax=Pomacea canaliculata TaxID=400727 RepID=A0A2T7PNP1_POMCA|nr:hypothetical protein C0Q70_06326 [Pomacea canaliculata]